MARSVTEKELFKLLEEYKGAIYRLCKVYFPYDKYHREALENEIVCRLWQGLGKFRKESTLPTWVYRIAINTAIEFSKEVKRSKKKMAKLSEVSCELENECDPLLEELYRLIERLDVLEKAVIYMYLDRKVQKDIAEALGLTETNVSTMIGRIKQKLRKLKEDDELNNI